MNLISFYLRCSRSIGYSRGLVAIVLAAGVVGGVSNTVVLALINKALSRGAASADALLWPFVGACLLLAASKTVAQLMLTRLATGTAYDMRVRLSRQILAAPLRHLEAVGSNRLLAALTDDIPTVTSTLTNLPNLCINTVIVLGCLIYVGWLSPPLLGVVVAAMSLGVLCYRLLGRRAHRYFALARESWEALMKHFDGLIKGSKELKLHHRRREEFIEAHLEAAAASLARHRVTAATTFAVAERWGEMLIILVIGLLIFAFSAPLGGGTEVLTGCVIAILYVMSPIQYVLNMLPMVSAAEVAVGKIEGLRASLAAQAREGETPPPRTAVEWRSLELAGVTHTYRHEGDNSEFTLGPIDLRLTRGEMVFLTGGNGSGKTTLAKVLTGLYAPEAGEIRLDGEAITDRNRDWYRQLFSAVFSDFHLFESLLGLGADGLDARAREYLAQLQLDRKVQIKEGALSTTELSQGQRKRLALLTAYLEDRPIYLFDEWAADQDPLFKEVFYFHLLPELKARGKTVCVISHDDRYYHIADRLVKLDYGKLSFDGLPPVGEAAPSLPAASR